MTLCVPDICAALESADGKTTRTKYKAWIDEYLVKARPDKYGDRLSADHIYQFRCAVLHQGRTKHDKGEYERILFFEPGAEISVTGIHCCIVGANTENRSLIIDLKQFCTDVVAGAKTWLTKNQENENYKTNYERLIRRYPEGITPVLGCPVIG